jgi:thioester reductase-like protein
LKYLKDCLRSFSVLPVLRLRAKSCRLWSMHREEVAIIGMAGRFPGAADVDALWELLRTARSGIREVTDGELDDARVPADVRADGRYVRRRGVVDQAEWFDAPAFAIVPSEAELIDPQQRLLLECAWSALEDAGIPPIDPEPVVGVFAGAALSTYLSHLLNVDASASITDLDLVLGNEASHAATRIGYKLGLRGPCIAVQTACSTSGVAVHMACMALTTGDCDVALAGGASLEAPGTAGYLYREGGLLSPDGACRVFDVRAQGTVPADGAAVVVLKRLRDALADGDHVHAVIRGTAVANDGSGKVGYTAPGVAGQVCAISGAYQRASIDPHSVSFIEAHGAGTPLGDPIEIAALRRAFGRGADADATPCVIGSLKSNLGHLGEAAGVTSLIKALLAVRHGEIPATLNFEQASPHLDLSGTRFVVSGETLPWPEVDGPRRAGVSTFGIGGTNAHIVVEQFDGPAPPTAGKEELLPLSARTEAAADAAVQRLAAWLDAQPRDRSLGDVASTLQTGRRAFPSRRVVVARTAGEALERLRGGARDASAAQGQASRDVATAWLGGVAVDWSLVRSGQRARVPLPGYPFERKLVRAEGERPDGLAALAVAPERAAAAPRELEAGELELRVAGVVASVLGIDEVTPSDNFFTLGGTSLLLVRLVDALERAFGVRVAMKDVVVRRVTAKNLAAVVGRALEVADGPPAQPSAVVEAAQGPARDIALDALIVPTGGFAATVADPARAVVTGATGFVGAFVLAELLRRTPARVTCLVRAGGEAQAAQRLRDTLAKYLLWDESFAARLRVVPGDLAAPRFGLSASRFAELAADVDVVFHSGAYVNFARAYEDLHAANVRGTEEVLRLAALAGGVPVQHVSTLAVHVGQVSPDGGAVDETTPLAPAEGLETGYQQSKWVAEGVVGIARARGIPVTIHRPAVVLGDSATGVHNGADLVWRLVRGCAQIGCYPSDHEPLYGAPVDHVARAIVALSRRPEAVNRTFHLIDPEPFSMVDLYERLADHGRVLTEVPYDDWHWRLSAAYQRSGDPQLAALLAAAIEPMRPEQIAPVRCDATLGQLTPEQRPHTDREAIDAVLARMFGAEARAETAVGSEPVA